MQKYYIDIGCVKTNRMNDQFSVWRVSLISLLLPLGSFIFWRYSWFLSLFVMTISTAWNNLMRPLQSYASKCLRVIWVIIYTCKSQRHHTDLISTSKAAHFYIANITFKQYSILSNKCCSRNRESVASTPRSKNLAAISLTLVMLVLNYFSSARRH